MDIGVNATHHVVHHRPHGDQLGHRVDVLVVCGTAHARTATLYRSGRRRGVAGRGRRRVRTECQRSFLFVLMHERLGTPVPGSELHAAQLWLGRGFAKVVVLQVAVAVFVQ